jgi:hypothetical protein
VWLSPVQAEGYVGRRHCVGSGRLQGQGVWVRGGLYKVSLSKKRVVWAWGGGWELLFSGGEMWVGPVSAEWLHLQACVGEGHLQKEKWE